MMNRIDPEILKKVISQRCNIHIYDIIIIKNEDADGILVFIKNMSLKFYITYKASSQIYQVKAVLTPCYLLPYGASENFNSYVNNFTLLLNKAVNVRSAIFNFLNSSYS
jgi:hypothetical protein